MREWGLLTTEVASVITPIRLLMRSAAATDPDLAALVKDSDHESLTRMRHHARFLAERGYLRDGVTVGEATGILWTCSSSRSTTSSSSSAAGRPGGSPDSSPTS